MTSPRARRLHAGVLVSAAVMAAMTGCGSQDIAGRTAAAQAVGSSAHAVKASGIAGCPMFPTDNIWNSDVSKLPVDSHSADYVNSIGASSSLHPDFGSGTIDGAPFGMPITYVKNDQPMVNPTFDYADESDQVGYPIPPDAGIEGGPDSDGDRHVLVVNTEGCKLYELFDAHPDGSSWHAGSGAVFDLNSNDLRPEGWTSTDAAGLPVTAGLVRLDEVQAGKIDHALRITVPRSASRHVWPARHDASSSDSASLPPMGQRLRLKADVDLSGYPKDDQVILQALKTYGAIVADNGSAWYLTGTQDEGWDNDVLNSLKGIKGSDFEAVDSSSLMVDEDSGQARQ
jgi:hypothetical protein